MTLSDLRLLTEQVIAISQRKQQALEQLLFSLQALPAQKDVLQVLYLDDSDDELLILKRYCDNHSGGRIVLTGLDPTDIKSTPTILKTDLQIYDVCICDYHIPGLIDGALAKDLLEVLPVIVATSSPSPETRRMLTSMGVPLTVDKNEIFCPDGASCLIEYCNKAMFLFHTDRINSTMNRVRDLAKEIIDLKEIDLDDHR